MSDIHAYCPFCCLFSRCQIWQIINFYALTLCCKNGKKHRLFLIIFKNYAKIISLSKCLLRTILC